MPEKNKGKSLYSAKCERISKLINKYIGFFMDFAIY